uniref:Glycerophosphodiester phosphodiesterase domain containing 1 n=1 Tax=Latimeria chalumnae TaxID=7897 RepID=H3AD63_LATCH
PTSMAFYLLSTLGGYVVTSVLLLKCPTLVHKKKKQRFTCRHISHRGGAGENLENTMAAFRHAVNLGTDMLELDCHMTKDGHVVVSHDDNLRRSTGINAKIADLRYSELPPYLCKLDVSFQRECCCEGGDDKRIPLLQEVFEAFPNTPVNIDIKENNDALIRKVSELIKQYKREDLTVWGNAHKKIVDKCYREFSKEIATVSSFKKTIFFLSFFFYSQTAPYKQEKKILFVVKLPNTWLKKLEDPQKLTRSQKFITWLADVLLMRKSLFDHLTARGIQVYVWVLNDEEDFKRAFDLGATGVMTDYPTKLKEFLAKYVP